MSNKPLFQAAPYYQQVAELLLPGNWKTKEKKLRNYPVQLLSVEKKKKVHEFLSPLLVLAIKRENTKQEVPCIKTSTTN